MVQLTLPRGSKPTQGKVHKAPEGSTNVKTYKVYRYDPEVEADPVKPDEFSLAADFLTADGALRTTPADMPNASPALSGLDGFFAARMRRIS